VITFRRPKSREYVAEERIVAIALRRMEVGFQNVQRCNQSDQLSESGQREKSRRGIWSRDLTCDHLPKAEYVA